MWKNAFLSKISDGTYPNEVTIMVNVQKHLVWVLFDDYWGIRYNFIIPTPYSSLVLQLSKFHKKQENSISPHLMKLKWKSQKSLFWPVLLPVP